MMLNKKLIVGAVITLFICGYGFAQSKNDAANSYNHGIKISDVDVAIDTIESCIKTCKIVGDSANQIKVMANNYLGDLYYKKSLKLYTHDKKFPEAIAVAKKALGIADESKDVTLKDRTGKLLLTIYVGMGANYFKAKNYEIAIKSFDSALIINPKFPSALFDKSLVYMTLGDTLNFGKTIDAFIESANAEKETAQVNQGKKIAFDFYSREAGKADQGNKLNDALNLLSQAEKYGTDKEIDYYYADVYNKLKKFDEALAYAQKGLILETGTPEAKAKYYYALAVAQSGKGDKENACESFHNSMYGPFVQASKAQITNLKCGK
jgi:tetratricopeptide (TPR) repeat protein